MQTGSMQCMHALAMLDVKSALDAWWSLASVFSGGMLGLFLLGMIAIVAYHRRQRPHAEAREAPLTDEEKRRLDDILKG